MKRFADIRTAYKTAHSYDVEVMNANGERGIVNVWANNRDQAAALARKAGYEVYSVNMVG